jgi:predicted nuclease with TOPRIM domain
MLSAHALPLSGANRDLIQEQTNDMEELVARLETSEERNKELQSTVHSVRVEQPSRGLLVSSILSSSLQSEEAMTELQEKLNAQESRQLADPNTPRKQVNLTTNLSCLDTHVWH